MPKNIDHSDMNEDANIKIQKLRMIVDDIIEHGTSGGDQTARQFVLSAVSKSDNENLLSQLEKFLFDNDEKELMKTVITGIFLQKNRFSPLIQYTNHILPDDLILGEEYNEKESLILLVDSLVNASDEKDPITREAALIALSKLYISACSQHSKAMIADKLLQRFINLIPQKKNDHIEQKLTEILQNSDSAINPRLVAIDILSRSNPASFYPTLEDLVLDFQSYVKSDSERLYMLDVITKVLCGYSASGYAHNLKTMLNELNGLNFVIKESNEVAEGICRRIQSRIKKLNDSINSNN